MAKGKLLICPYCGDAQPAGDSCRACGGLFEQLSRQATHNAMGPWFIRNEERPFQPGCSYETIVRLIERGQITKLTILRGPTTKQFWTVARRAAGIAHLLGYCPQCDASVDPGDHGCHACGIPFGAYLDRNYLGLPEVKPLPWEADVEDDLTESSHGMSMGLEMSPSTHGRLSSFGSDAELRRGASEPPSRHVASEPSVASAMPQATTATATGQEPEHAPMPASTSTEGLAARAMRRRIAKQQRTVRTLLFLLAVVGLLLVISNLGLILGGDDEPAATPAGSETTTRQPDAPPADLDPVEPPIAAPDETDVEEAAVGDDATREDAAGDDAAPGPLIGPEIELEQPEVRLDTPEDKRALALLAESVKDDRELEARLIDCEAALEILRELQASGVGDTVTRQVVIDHAEAMHREIVGTFYAGEGAT